MTQGFFERLLSHQAFQRLEPTKGGVRAFLRVALQRYLQETHEADHRRKRAGGKTHIHWDGLSAEARYRYEPIEPCTPEQLFERRWSPSSICAARSRCAGPTNSLFGRAAKFSHERTLPAYPPKSADWLLFAWLNRDHTRHQPAAEWMTRQSTNPDLTIAARFRISQPWPAACRSRFPEADFEGQWCNEAMGFQGLDGAADVGVAGRRRRG